MSEYIEHYGTPRHSGRYPYGSGENPYQRTSRFLQRVEELQAQGLTKAEIAASFKMSQNQLDAKKSAERNAERKSEEAYAWKLKQKGYSNVAIGERMGRNESYVRTLLKPSENQLRDDVNKARDSLKEQIETLGMIDVGAGTELHLNGGISRAKMKAALAGLEEEGYVIETIQVPQVSGNDQYTTLTVLAKPGTEKSYINQHRSEIQTIATRESNLPLADSNRILPPVSVSSKRIQVLYGEDGGAEQDGLIEIRPGSDDLSLGRARYAQARIAVDGTHYLKGMAVYSDDLPDGVDIRFSTPKSKKVPLKGKNPGDPEILKRLSDDPENPFESTIRRQIEFTDKKGKQRQSAVNIVNEEGDWDTWSKSLSSQFVSKQRPAFAKKQLGIALGIAKDNFDEAMQITNPAVKKRLLASLADELDADAVHLQAAGLPRQNWRVLIPIRGMKDNEVFAPDYRNGEKVVLVRFPHAGIFELPELTVNNNNPKARKLLGDNPFDAIGINHKVAEKMSGADFDGDAVLVLPNNNGAIKTSKSLPGLKGFDPKTAYPHREGMKVMSKASRGRYMGDITNLITDMQVIGAPVDEIARAVRHSMVVIDASKHKLDYTRSYDDNGIANLKKRYQGGANKGAATLISRASSQAHVPQRRLRKASKGGPIDPITGEKVYELTGRTHINKAGKKVLKTTKSTKMAEARDTFTLSSGTAVENLYAQYANELKAMANKARKELLATPSIRYSPSAKKVYAREVAQLVAALNVAKKNAPLERKAQLIANERISKLRKDNPSMEKDHLKKLKGRELTQARLSVGSKKQLVQITPRQWEAIQAGAISQSRLEEILQNADLTRVKELALPKTRTGLTPNKEARAKSMAASGYTRAAIADALGVSVSSVSRALNG